MDQHFELSSLLEETAIVAWSMGAMMALKAALPSESSIRKLVLISATGNFCHPDYGWSPRILDRMIKRLDCLPDETITNFHKGIYDDSDYLSLFNYQNLCRAGWTKESLTCGLHFLKTFNCAELYSQLNADCLWIHGEKDKICPIQAIRALPDPKHELILADSGHLPFWQSPELIAKEIMEFVK